MTVEMNADAPAVVVDMGEFSPYASRHRLTDAAATARGVVVHWDDGSCAEFNAVWLRDHCACAECRHPQTHERTVSLLDLPDPMPRPNVRVTDAGALHLQWPATGGQPAHESLFDPGWLRQRAEPSASAKPSDARAEVWDATFAQRVPSVAFSAFMDTDAGLHDWLSALARFGLALLEQGPTEEGEVVRVAERVGWPRETNFGRHFDVVSKPNPNNAAYTAIALEPHIDLPNWQRPPDFQLLYCLENAAEGGASVFTDGFAVAEALRAEDPEGFEVLATRPVDFRFQDEGADIAYRAPVIGLDEHGGLAEIRFNNWIRDTLRLPARDVEPFYRAYRRFWELLRDSRFAIRFTLAPGQMVAFDNLRVLHGRDAFDPNTGRRHLQGTYLDRDLIRSRLRVLERSVA